jgi:3-isopropylmalate/(R)-2-methylmalate dehydratase large subunit
LGKGVTAKDVALYLMSNDHIGRHGLLRGICGSVVRNMSMEGRLTLCNLSIEMGARGGFVAPDETTFAYIKGREICAERRGMGQGRGLLEDAEERR